MKNNFKKDFPIFTNRPKLIYLDSAATSQKPKAVIDAVTNFYTKYNSNVHRGVYDLSFEATKIYEGARKKIADFINAKDPAEIIFTGNTTEAINLVALGYAKKTLKKGDIAILTEMEHHSNIIPWLRLKQELGIKIFYLPIDSNFGLDYKVLDHANLNFKKVKIISLTHASNVLGTINPLEEIIPILRKKCVNAKFLIDAAQSVAHIKIDVQKLHCDFLAFSAHKMYGPSGVGVLWVKQKLLKDLEPIFSGSHMIETVTEEKATLAPPPAKFEAGTGKLEAVAGFGAAVDYINSIGFKNIMKFDQALTEYGIEKLSKIKGIKTYGSKNKKNRLPIFAFNLLGVHPHDVSEILNRSSICVRTGHHCAQVLLQTLNIPNALRASFSIYNSTSDMDKLVEGIEKAKKYLKSDMQDPLYREIILEHWQNPQNYGTIKNPDIDASEINATCGDKIRLTGKIRNGKLMEIAFTGEGCAISKASSSLFTQNLKGMELTKIRKIDKEDVLKNLSIEISPARYNCALLCFRALQKGLK